MIRERSLFWTNLPSSGLGHRLGLTGRSGRPLWLHQAARYSAVGIFNTLLDAGLYLLLTHWLGLAGLKLLAKGISYTVGTLNSFHWNRTWTFRSDARLRTQFVLFALASLMAIGINTACMGLGLDLFRQAEIPALILATGLTLVFNFTVSKFIVFRSQSES